MAWIGNKRVVGLYVYRGGGAKFPAYVRFENDNQPPFQRWAQISGDNREDTIAILSVLMDARSQNRRVRVDIKGDPFYVLTGVYA